MTDGGERTPSSTVAATAGFAGTAHAAARVRLAAHDASTRRIPQRLAFAMRGGLRGASPSFFKSSHHGHALRTLFLPRRLTMPTRPIGSASSAWATTSSPGGADDREDLGWVMVLTVSRSRRSHRRTPARRWACSSDDACATYAASEARRSSPFSRFVERVTALLSASRAIVVTPQELVVCVDAPQPRSVAPRSREPFKNSGDDGLIPSVV